jgi:hypothetical protein
MLDGIRVHLSEKPWPLLALGVAGWMRYVSGTDDAATRLMFAIRSAIKSARWSSQQRRERVNALLGLSEIFGHDLPQTRVCGGGQPGLSAHHPPRRASGCYRNVKYLTIIALNANGKPPFALPLLIGFFARMIVL